MCIILELFREFLSKFQRYFYRKLLIRQSQQTVAETGEWPIGATGVVGTWGRGYAF